MVVLSVLAVSVLPALNYMTDTRSVMAAKTLLHDVSFARQRAIATGTNSWVVFDTGAETWSLLAEDTASPGRADAVALNDPATNADYVRQLDADSFVGVEILSAAFDGDVEIGFDWLGQPLNAAETALTAQGSVTLTGNHAVNVAISTGYVQYVEP